MFFRKKLERRLESEIDYHIERVTQSYVAQGMDGHEARRQALLEFGGATQIREDLRDVHRSRWLADLRQDLAYAARTLRRSPGFLACAVMTLGLGIGANTAIFSLIDALMLRPMPVVHDPARLVQISRMIPEHCEDCRISYPLFEYFRDRLSSVSGAFIVMDIAHEITVDGVDENVNADEVSGAFYSALGLAPAAGRLLGPEDDAAPTPVAVISYDYWRRRFGLNPAAIGKSIVYANTALTIVGVEPEGFEGIEPWRTRDFTAPLSMTDRLGGGNGGWKRQWDLNFFEMMARLKPGVSIARANAEIASVFGVWRTDKARELPGPFYRQRFLKERALAMPGLAGLNGLRVDFIKPLGILMGIVALVLLLACANLSGLLLARASSRQREISIRRAIGAGNGRLTRQFLAESLLLAACGAIAGLAIAQWFGRALVTMMANGDQLPLGVSPDWRIFAFTGAVSLLACIFAGLAPGLSAGRVSVNPALKETRAGGGHRSLGRLLVVAQLAISMTLLVGAGLFIRTLVKLYSVDTGIRRGGIFVFNLNAKHHFPPERSVEIQTAIVDRLRSLPGVTFATAANMLPLTGGLWTRQVQPEGYTFHAGEDDSAAFNSIAPQYFGVTGTPLLLGRDFNQRDTETASPVAIVSQTFARAFFGGQPPLGRHVTSNKVTYEVVGVAKDAKYEGLRQGVPRTMYIPWVQQGDMALENRSQPMGYTYLARVASGDPMRLSALVAHAIPEIEPAMHMWNPQTLDAYVNRSMLNERMMATLGGFFGLLALIVACLGIFGILAFQVSRRTNEIGVRVALGATRNDIVRLVMREVTMLLAPGCAIGAVCAVWLARFANSFLFGVTSTDPAALALAAGTLAVSTLAAGFLPALRAARIDPMAALRCD
jgi:predicted permease